MEPSKVRVSLFFVINPGLLGERSGSRNFVSITKQVALTEAMETLPNITTFDTDGLSTRY